MNHQDRAELERLKERQFLLQSQVDQVRAEIHQLEVRLETANSLAAESPEIKPLEISPSEIPPLEGESFVAQIASRESSAVATTRPQPPIIALAGPSVVPPPLIEQSVQTPRNSERPQLGFFPANEIPPESISAPTAPVKDSSFEMRLGTFWLVRIGVFVLLTGLAFLGNYALGRLGAPGKVALLYGASGLLLGAGAWWQRKNQNESMKNYAQVLFASGLAAVYFTTYAAHYIPNLKVIQNQPLAGFLLLAWAGFIVFLADRKKSEVLAMFATGLAYYTSIITNIGEFTLYSNLVLTVASVVLLWRNRWARLSFGSIVLTYASFAFWRFYHNGWFWDWEFVQLWHANIFLLGYWAVFSAAVFLSRSEKLAHGARAAFATFNNGAFFSLIILSMLRQDQGNFWKFSLAFGGVLLMLTAVAKRFLAGEPLVRNSYLTQGLLLVTVGFIAHYSGLQLGLILAAESVVLIVLGYSQRNLILQFGAFLTATMAAGSEVYWMLREYSVPIDFTVPGGQQALLGGAIGALIFFNAFWSRRHDPSAQQKLFLPASTAFTALALLVWAVTTWAYIPEQWLAPVLAVESLLLAASTYIFKVKEAAFLGQTYLLLAQFVCLSQAQHGSLSRPWWNPVIVIAATLGLSHWWQRQRSLKIDQTVSTFLQGLYALAVIGVLFSWLHPQFQPSGWLAFTSLLAIVITAYGIVTRAWLLAGFGQIFLAVSICEFVQQLLNEKPDWYFAAAPILSLLLTAFVVAAWLKRKAGTIVDETDREPIARAGEIYRWVAALMTLWWVNKYIPVREQFWILSLLGTLIFLAGGWLRNSGAFLFSALFFGAGFVDFALFPMRGAPSVYWPNLVPIFVLLCLQQFARRFPQRYNLESEWLTGMILLGGGTLWLFVSRSVILKSGGQDFFLTVSWAALALVIFAAGLALRERIYRWLGLGILGCALGRVVISDVWRLETLHRILSFMALGIVLLVLGFLYNKYQDKIKEWI